jgi:ABC-2 type transport system ATP-binding protein
MNWGLEDVRISRGGKIALAGVTVPVEASRVTVVVGGDGAGKSTCLATLAGLLEPEEGAVHRPAKERIGYVPATAGLYGDLTVRQNLDFAAAAYRLSHAERDQRAELILRRTGLTRARDRLGGRLSGGMQRKLAVGMALLHGPELLILDEPTTGVDPVSRAEVWRLISRASVDGAAVAVATTYVNEAARAAHVVLLEAGRVLADGAPGRILRDVPGAVGSWQGAERPAPLAWRRGTGWRVWAPAGTLPDGVEPARADFEDAVVISALASEGDR